MFKLKETTIEPDMTLALGKAERRKAGFLRIFTLGDDMDETGG